MASTLCSYQQPFAPNFVGVKFCTYIAWVYSPVLSCRILGKMWLIFMRQKMICVQTWKLLRKDLFPAIIAGEVRLIGLTNYHIPGSLPKVREVAFVFGIFGRLFGSKWSVCVQYVGYNHFLFDPVDMDLKLERGVICSCPGGHELIMSIRSLSFHTNRRLKWHLCNNWLKKSSA